MLRPQGTVKEGWRGRRKHRGYVRGRGPLGTNEGDKKKSKLRFTFT